MRPGGIPSTASRRIIVRALTPEFLARFSMDQFKAARPARIWAPRIIDKPYFVTLYDNIVVLSDVHSLFATLHARRTNGHIFTLGGSNGLKSTHKKLSKPPHL